MTEPWATILADPTVPFDRAALRLVVADQRRWSRRYLYPLVRPLSRLTVTLIRVVKTLVPLRRSAHTTMDTLCVWFLHRFVSPDAGELLIRHFLIETNLLNFLTANSPGTTPSDVVTLRPTTLRELGNGAVIQHDLNVYDVLSGLGAGIDTRPVPRPLPAGIDFDAVSTVPAIDPERDRRRWVSLDIQTALCLMNIPFVLCLTPAEYRRAVHSLRLDESLLAAVTGDATFWRWQPSGVSVRVDSGLDVPRAVYEHAVICEYAHERLRHLAAGAVPGGGSGAAAAGPAGHAQAGVDADRRGAGKSGVLGVAPGEPVAQRGQVVLRPADPDGEQ